MNTLAELFRNFFTHKDFLPPPDQWPGTLFSPLQIVFCACIAVLIGYASVKTSKMDEKRLKKIFFWLWLIMVVTEPLIVIWESNTGLVRGRVNWAGDLSLWPCSIFLYAAPFAIFGKGDVRYAACGYICTLGLLGGAINFVYPATYIARYSCISLPGLRTIFYHGAMIYTAVTMLLSGYHCYSGVTDKRQLILPAVPALLVSIPANIANFVVPDADYMFFKFESFFFAPIGEALPDAVTIVIVYVLYLTVHALPYLPSYIRHTREADETDEIEVKV